ncbi:hypothetical protein [Paenibacillus sp. YYML68]|uniref:hypothetical protein n=1 Tax=Paenibacillus sp. YYML68 TaxID=2909250 RepID=UPI0024916D74|nr:hypothetical protein [Paenibacillus sp. YYML68]
MLKEALNKLQAEVTAKPKDKYVAVVAAFLMNHVRSNPQHAELILAQGKNIEGSVSAMKEEARKQQQNGVGVLTDEEGFATVLKYYGVAVVSQAAFAQSTAPATLNVSLDDLF